MPEPGHAARALIHTRQRSLGGLPMEPRGVMELRRVNRGRFILCPVMSDCWKHYSSQLLVGPDNAAMMPP